MRITILDPIGAEVTDFAVAGLSARRSRSCAICSPTTACSCCAGRRLTINGSSSSCSSFGELAFTEGETPVPGHPDLNVVTNAGRTTPPRNTFHVDTSYVRRPPTYTALRAVKFPLHGGETLFTNQYRAYATLPADVLERAARAAPSRTTVTGVQLDDGDERSAEHPVFARHPITGRTALYISTPSRCTAISGLDRRGSARSWSPAVRALDPRGQRLPPRLDAGQRRHLGQPVRLAPGRSRPRGRGSRDAPRNGHRR